MAADIHTPEPSQTAVAGVTEKSLPDLPDEPTPFKDLAPAERTRVEALTAEIDMRDSNSIIFFGTQAQEKLTALSDKMLEGVKNKDAGPAADSLNTMIATLRGFGTGGLAEKPGFFARLFGHGKPVVKFLQQYEDVRRQVDSVTDRLEEHKTALLTDIASLDRLYDANLEYFHELDDYITAGDEKLRQIDADVIPALHGDAARTEDVIHSQQLRDLRSARDDLERRVHDLRLTRQVTMQSLPSIRLVQENDKSLVRKIHSTVANTIPLWRQQLAQAITIYRSGQAADTIKEASDLTNELLQKTSETLKTANREIREQVERGVFDIEVVARANQNLIETIEESLRIADDGKQMRALAIRELQTLESTLHDALASASARATHADPARPPAAADS
jgi:uncharacterized protein YaaN involved in tellurite resistance